jgi:DNA segregation ATPase FtsK/SpoIIIE, S-DNA-T family
VEYIGGSASDIIQIGKSAAESFAQAAVVPAGIAAALPPSAGIATPGVPSVPGMATPGIPGIPGVPSVPGVPGVPAGVPQVPAMGVPAAVGVPQVPGVAVAPNPGFLAGPAAGIPAVPGVPQVPQVPQVPVAPAAGPQLSPAALAAAPGLSLPQWLGQGWTVETMRANGYLIG